MQQDRFAPESGTVVCTTAFPKVAFVATVNQDNSMKTLKCDLCDYEAQGATFEEWMEALKPHYLEAHADVMNDTSKTAADMANWMAENKRRFEAA